LDTATEHHCCGEEDKTGGPDLKEAIEIEHHPNNMYRENCFSLSWTRRPLIHDLKEWKQSYTKELTLSSGT
jgi:hypothetical protein